MKNKSYRFSEKKSKYTTIEKIGLKLSQNINDNVKRNVFPPDQIYDQEINPYNEILYYGSIGHDMGSGLYRDDSLSEIRGIIELKSVLSTHNNGSEIVLYEEL